MIGNRPKCYLRKNSEEKNARDGSVSGVCWEHWVRGVANVLPSF